MTSRIAPSPDGSFFASFVAPLVFAVCAVGCGDSDYQAHEVGDGCDGFVASCSVDGTQLLSCEGDVFVVEDACADGCVTAANGLVSVGPDSVCCDNGDDRTCVAIH